MGLVVTLETDTGVTLEIDIGVTLETDTGVILGRVIDIEAVLISCLLIIFVLGKVITATFSFGFAANLNKTAASATGRYFIVGTFNLIIVDGFPNASEIINLGSSEGRGNFLGSVGIINLGCSMIIVGRRFTAPVVVSIAYSFMNPLSLK